MPGQITLLVLTFIGGLGFMVVASLLLLNAGHRISSLLQEDTGHTPYPGNGNRLAVRIALVVVGIQFVGFLVLLVRFSFIEPMSDAIWKALSMTVLAFNNAGFIGLHGVEDGGALRPRLVGPNNCRRAGRAGCNRQYRHTGYRPEEAVGHPFTQYEDRTWYDRTGCPVWALLHLLLLEFENPATIGDLRLGDKVSMSAFEAIAGRTSGLTTVDYSQTEEHTSLLMMGLMLVGGASASVAGGIKINTVTLLIVAILTAAVGRSGPSAFKRENVVHPSQTRDDAVYIDDRSIPRWR